MSEVVQNEIVSNNNNAEGETSVPENGNVLGSSLSASVSSLASSSGASAKSGIPKLVGIKPAGHSVAHPTSHSTAHDLNNSASRIGRLCGNQHKPALPSSPVKSSKSNLSTLVNVDFCSMRKLLRSMLICQYKKSLSFR